MKINAKKIDSAGMVKQSFWFAEFRKVMELLLANKTWAEIKQLNDKENILQASTKARGTLIFNRVAARIKNLDTSFYPVFSKSDVGNQKIIVLIAIMETDHLFFCFMHEVYREKLIIGVNELRDSDIAIFFRNKQLQSDKVASWTEDTLKRLGTCYKTLLTEAGVIDRSKGIRKIKRPILDRSLEDCLIKNGMEATLHALTGVR